MSSPRKPAARKPAAKGPSPRTTAAGKPATRKPATRTRAAAGHEAKEPAAAKKTGATRPGTAREVAKVSPLRGMAVEEYIRSRITGWQQGVARRIVALVARAAPASTVSIKWSQPVFEHNGPFAFLKPAKAHLTFGFWRGAQMADAPNFERGDRMGHIKLKDASQLDERLLERMVREAVQLNATNGDPTRRG